MLYTKTRWYCIPCDHFLCRWSPYMVAQRNGYTAGRCRSAGDKGYLWRCGWKKRSYSNIYLCYGFGQPCHKQCASVNPDPQQYRQETCRSYKGYPRCSEQCLRVRNIINRVHISSELKTFQVIFKRNFQKINVFNART